MSSKVKVKVRKNHASKRRKPTQAHLKKIRKKKMDEENEIRNRIVREKGSKAQG